MRRHQRFLALLLACVYAVVSTVGIAFVICVEGDGSHNAEIIGAACCANGSPVGPHGETPSVDSEGAGDECESCLTHRPAWNVDAPRFHGDRHGATTTQVPPPAPSPVTAPAAWLVRPAHLVPVPPPRRTLQAARLRSVVLRC